MAKPGRNDRCPCGSGKKYKACCLTKDESDEHQRLAEAQAARDGRAAEKRHRLDAARAAMMARLSGAAGDEMDDDPTEASNAILDLIRAGKLDEAETAARDLLDRYPEIHDGWDRLGMVHEARGERAQAIECYRRVVAFLDENPDYSEPDFKQSFVDQIAKLETPDPA
jgi:tetratricopeptide (TPR) repeat protein